MMIHVTKKNRSKNPENLKTKCCLLIIPKRLRFLIPISPNKNDSASSTCILKCVFTSRSWQEEEDQEAVAPPPTLETEARSSHPTLPRNHRFRRSQGRIPRKDRLRHECLQPDQETPRQRWWWWILCNHQLYPSSSARWAPRVQLRTSSRSGLEQKIDGRRSELSLFRPKDRISF